MILLDAKAYTIASWVGVVLMFVAVVMLGILGNWLGLLLSLVFLVSSIAFMTLRNEVPSLFDLLFVIAALANGAGWIWGLYSEVFGYDEVVHAYTSFAISLWFGFLVYDSMLADFRDRGLLFGLVIATFGLAAGAAWEMIEYTLIQLKDPVRDLMVDAVGAALAGLFATWVLKGDPQLGHHRGATKASKDSHEHST